MMKMLKNPHEIEIEHFDGMSILHHCTASYQRRYHFFLPADSMARTILHNKQMQTAYQPASVYISIFCYCALA